MKKQLIIGLILAVVVSVLLFVIHKYMISPDSLDYSIDKVYLFHGIFAINIVLFSSLVSSVMKEYVGFVFLAVILIKMIFIYITFPEVLRLEKSLPKHQLLHFLAPYFAFLIFEAYLVIRLLYSDYFKELVNTPEAKES
ncbi:MAG: DUF6168 family protein [Flavobacteriales bacterium]|jgi:hypothetical protein|nr:DUF6168 family protein [Flavobacteriales bacterium]